MESSPAGWKPSEGLQLGPKGESANIRGLRSVACTVGHCGAASVNGVPNSNRVRASAAMM